MEMANRKSISDALNKYDYLRNKDDDTFIEITEWTNEEGIDVSIGDNKMFSLTYGQIDAINYLINKLRYEYKESV